MNDNQHGDQFNNGQPPQQGQPGPHQPQGPYGEPAPFGGQGPYDQQGHGQPSQQQQPSADSAPYSGQQPGQQQYPQSGYPQQPHPQQPSSQYPGSQHQGQPYAAGAYGQQPQNDQQKPRKKRLGLILGISIPVALLLILGIVAALVVPGMIKQQKIDQAVETYNGQVSAWESTFTDEKLLGIESAFEGVDPESLAAGYRDENPGDSDYVDPMETCSQLDSLRQLRDELGSGAAPDQPMVEDAEGNADYDAIVADYQSKSDRFAASGDLLAALDTNVDRLASLCEMQASYAAIWDAQTPALAALEDRQSQMKNGEKFEVKVSDGTWTVTCTSSSGCWKSDTADSRKKNHEAWVAAWVNFAKDSADFWANNCPTEDVQEDCDAWADYYTERAKREQKIADALLVSPKEDLENHEESQYSYNTAIDDFNSWNDKNRPSANNSENPLYALADEWNALTGEIIEARDTVLA